MLKGATRFFLLFFSCLALFIMVLPINVIAEEEDTYTYLQECTLLTWGNWRELWASFSSPVRAVVISNSSSTSISVTVGYCFVSESEFTLSFQNIQSENDFSCGVKNLSSYEYNGYYMYIVYANTGDDHYNIPHVIDSDFNQSVQKQKALYYTFGEGAIGPDALINYGGIYNLSYSTNIAGSGSAAINNIDIIKWNPVTDDVGNELPEDAIINLRAVPGKYSANSKQGLLEKLYSDFVLNNSDLVLLASISVSQEEYQVSWRSVVDRLNIPFSTINSLISTDDTWLKYGWVYECQLSIPSAEYVGEWQMVYTSTSSGVENDLTIIDNSIGINQTLITVMQNINTINDNDSIWYINDVPVNPNPEYKPPEDDTEEPWYMKILEMIYNSLGLTNQYINEGTNESNNAVNEFNNDNDDLVININEYDDIEDSIIDDFNDNVQELDIDNELYQNSNFISSARWISEQFTNLISDNPIGSILKFSLIFGFILIFLGRFR